MTCSSRPNHPARIDSGITGLACAEQVVALAGAGDGIVIWLATEVRQATHCKTATMPPLPRLRVVAERRGVTTDVYETVLISAPATLFRDSRSPRSGLGLGFPLHCTVSIVELERRRAEYDPARGRVALIFSGKEAGLAHSLFDCRRGGWACLHRHWRAVYPCPTPPHGTRDNPTCDS
jgi:hypothetical protein